MVQSGVNGKTAVAVEHFIKAFLRNLGIELHFILHQRRCGRPATWIEGPAQALDIGGDIAHEDVAVARSPIAARKAADRLIVTNNLDGIIENSKTGPFCEHIERQIE